jgi:hypothetical protein
VPPELTTDHVKVLMLSDSWQRAVISQGLFARTIKWGNPNAKPAVAPPVKPRIRPRRKPTEKAKVERPKPKPAKKPD